MDKKLIVTDIDGTLISRRFKILDSTKEEFSRLQKEGHIIAIASGRPAAGVMFYAKEIELDKYGGYVISFNGGRMLNTKTGEEICPDYLSKNILQKVQQYAIEHGLGTVTYDGDVIIRGTPENIYMKLEKEVCRVEARYVEDFSSLDCNPPKAIISCDGEVAEKHLPVIKKMLAEEAEVFRSEPFFIEIMPKGLDKAVAVKELAQALGIGMENTVCFGDGYNDVTMLGAAGIGIAMGNACDEAKAAAKFVTHSCDDDGIAYAIKNILRI